MVEERRNPYLLNVGNIKLSYDLNYERSQAIQSLEIPMELS